MLQKISVPNGLTVFTKRLTLIIIRHVSYTPSQHIRMISEGSCDTADWSNDAENSALPSQE